MAISNGSGAGRVKPSKRAAHGQDSSIDDDATQVPSQVVAFTVQSMVTTNNTNGNKTNPYTMIV